MTALESWLKRHESRPGAIPEAAKLFGVTVAEARQAYDRVYMLPVEAAPKTNNEKEEPVEKKPAASLSERAALYARLRTEGANPDEAAQGVGYKDFKAMQSSLLTARGIRISSKAPYLLPDDAPRKVVKAKPEPKPKPELELELELELEDKPRTLRPICWNGKHFIYTDVGEYIDIQPREGNDFQLTHDDLRQFSEEINELLEIIK